MKKIFLITIFCTWIGANILPGSVYSLDTLIEAGMKHDFSLQQLQHQLKILQLQQVSVKTSYLPGINASLQAMHQSKLPILNPSVLGIQSLIPPREIGVKDQFDGTVQFNWLLFGGFVRNSNMEIIQNSTQSILFQKRFKNKQIPALIKTLAFQTRMYELSIKSLYTSAERIEINLDRARKLLNSGFASALDTLEFASRLTELALDIKNFEKLREQTLITLRYLTGIRDIQDINFPTDLTQLPPVESISRDLQQNYFVSLLEFEKNELAIRKKMHKAAFYPEIFAFGGFHYGRPGVDFFNDKWMSYWKVGIQLQWNLFNWGADKRKLKQDDIAFHIKQLQKENIQREEKIKLEKQLTALKEIEERLSLLKKLRVQKTEKLSLTTRQWENGQKTSSDVMSAEHELTGITLQEKNLHMQYRILYEAVKLIINQ